MSLHWVQHTPSTAFTQDCSSSLYSHDYELTSECSFSFMCASLHDRLPSASYPWELTGKVTLTHCNCCMLTDWWIDSQHPECRSLAASLYSSKLTRFRPPSFNAHGLHVHLDSLDHDLRVHLWVYLMTPCKCISQLARLWPPSSHNLSLQVPLHTHSITISECASKFTRSRPPSVSPNTLDYRLEVHHHTRSIVASQCISECCWSSCWSALRIALKNRLQPVQIYCV